MTPISESVVQTLRYSDHFDFPLTVDELYERLIGVKTAKQDLTHTLSHMVQKKQISKSKNYYHLPGRQRVVKMRIVRQQESHKLWERAHTISSILGKVPGVRAIFVTGSVAMRNVKGDDDIDLMIVTKPGRLWQTRLILTGVTSCIGRRLPEDTVSPGKVCLNLYLTPESFLLPARKRSLYTAYELIQAIPMYDPHSTRTLLLHANPWIKKYLPNFAFPSPSHQVTKKPSHYSVFEKLSFRLQLAYMKNRMTNEYVTRDSAFFHPNSPGEKVLKAVFRRGMINL